MKLIDIFEIIFIIFIVLLVDYLIICEVLTSATGEGGEQCIKQGMDDYCKSLNSQHLIKQEFTGGLSSKLVDVHYCKKGDSELAIDYNSDYLLKCSVAYDIGLVHLSNKR